MADTAWQWRPQGVAELLDNTFKVFRARFGLFFAINAAIMVPLAVVQNVLLPQAPLSLLDQLVTNPESLAAEMLVDYTLSINWAQLVLAQLLIVVIAMVASALQMSATMWTANEYLHGARPDLGAAFSGGLKYMMRVLGVRLLLTVMFVVAVIVLTFTSAIFGALGGVGFAVLLLLGGLACFGIFVGIRWLLTFPVFIGEDADFGQAVTRSYELSRGAIGALLGRYLLFVLLYFVLATVPITAVSALVELVPWGGIQLQIALSSLAGALIGAVVQPLMPIMLILLYYDRRVRLEGYDLQQRAAQLGRDT